MARVAGPYYHLIGWAARHFGAGGKNISPPKHIAIAYHFLNKKRAMLLSCSAAELTDTLGSEQMYSLNNVAEAIVLK